MSEEFDFDKKWKYLQFLKSDCEDGWSFNNSDEPSDIPRNQLLSAAQVYIAIHADECFSLVFNAVSSDPQFVECSDGLHEASQCIGTKVRWLFFPVLFNRNMWKQFSHYIRLHRWCKKEISARDFCWMNICQLELARVLMAESLEISDTSEIDRLLAYKKEEFV